MPVPCAPPFPVLPGAPLPVQNLVLSPPPPPPLPPPRRWPEAIRPRFVSDFQLNGPLCNHYWLATLCRASYSLDGALLTQAARAACEDAVVTYVANGAGLVPGYAIVRIPEGAIVVVSGTTNPGQWMEQVFSNGLVELSKLETPGLRSAKTMALYKTAAATIWAAVAPLVPNDEQILWTGHSMGGAVAELLHAYNGDSDNGRVPSRCVTFAAPKPGDDGLKSYMRQGAQTFRRWILQGDFVPALPPDLTIFNVTVPSVFAGPGANWSQFKQPGTPYSLSTTGVLEDGADPFLPLLMTSAMINAAAGRPVTLTSAHVIKTYCDRFAAGPGGQPVQAATERWALPQDVGQVNAILDALAL